MIIKFDHIALTCKISEWKDELAKLSDYIQVFANENVPNLPLKKDLMSTWHENHVIALLVAKNDLPIEITAYDTVAEKPAKYEFSDDTVSVYTKSTEDSMAFYEAFGFRKTGDFELEKSFLIAPSSVKLRLRQTIHDASIASAEKGSDFDQADAGTCDAPQMPCLDQAGYCCLAFVTNNAEKERTRLIQKGITVTEIDELTLGEKILKIFFAYNTCGDVCELIEVLDKGVTK
ncbi:MAG: hypothetical protein J5546_11250 [Lachnospiraceae bacterium]|nr:hypothetical protein [Lachnospiraceae bacterium]